MRILVVDDEQPLLEQLRRLLEQQRYIVETAVDGEDALDKLFGAPFDLVVLDIMMPKVDGLTVLEHMRDGKIDTPVLMLTAKNDVRDRVRGLDLGADDYLAKPFSLDELMARLRALIRRSVNSTDTVLQIGDLKLDTVSRRVTRSGTSIDLTPREFSILEFLLYNKDRTVSRFNLAEHVWGEDFDPFSMSNFIDVHMKNLRNKITVSGNDNVIRTVRGVGFIIEEPER